MEKLKQIGIICVNKGEPERLLLDGLKDSEFVICKTNENKVEITYMVMIKDYEKDAVYWNDVEKQVVIRDLPKL